MKYAHLEENTNKLLGWYDDSIHDSIPTPNIEVTENQWQDAININANCYENGEFIVKDFRTQEEIEKQEAERLEIENKAKKAQELSSIVVTTSKGNSFDGNETARLNMLSAIQTSELLGITENDWKLADNSIAVVDVSELKEALALSIQEVGNIVKKY